MITLHHDFYPTDEISCFGDYSGRIFLFEYRIPPSWFALSQVSKEKLEEVLRAEASGFQMVCQGVSSKGNFGVAWKSNLYKLIVTCYGEGVVFSSAETKEGEVVSDSKYFPIRIFYGIGDKAYAEKLLETIRAKAHLSNVKMQNSKIHFLCRGEGSFYLRQVDSEFFPEFDLQLNYGSKFAEIHQDVVAALKSTKSGLALFHGPPGVGKTSYIRYLLSELNEKIIYIPPSLVSFFANPEFLTFLLEHPNSIFIVEDAEEIVKNREETGNVAGVSNLLNMSDGIIGSCLRMKIICTFNTHIDNIDPALLRKGRLAIAHEFKALSKEDSQKLLDHLGSKFEAVEEMTLADIYNYAQKPQYEKKEKGPIGFAQPSKISEPETRPLRMLMGEECDKTFDEDEDIPFHESEG